MVTRSTESLMKISCNGPANQSGEQDVLRCVPCRTVVKLGSSGVGVQLSEFIAKLKNPDPRFVVLV